MSKKEERKRNALEFLNFGLKKPVTTEEKAAKTVMEIMLKIAIEIEPEEERIKRFAETKEKSYQRNSQTMGKINRRCNKC